MHNRILNPLVALLLISSILVTTTGCSSKTDSPLGLTPDSVLGAEKTPEAQAGSVITLAIAPKYDYVSSFSEGLAVTQLTDSETNSTVTSYIDKQGNTVLTLPPEIVWANAFQNGIALVFRENATTRIDEYNYIDATGKFQIEQWLQDTRGFGGGQPPIYKYSRILELEDISDQVSVSFFDNTAKDGSWVGILDENMDTMQAAIFDKNCKVLIPFGIYSDITINPDGNGAVVSRKVGTNADGSSIMKYGAINIDGSEIIPTKYDIPIHYVNNQAYCTKKSGTPDGIWPYPLQLLLLDGTLVDPEGYTAIDFKGSSNENEIGFRTADDLYGTMDLTGKVLVAPSETGFGNFHDTPTDQKSTSSKTAPIVPDGMTLLCEYDEYISIATAAVRSAEGYLDRGVRVGLADTKGNILVKPTNEAISGVTNGVYVACVVLDLIAGAIDEDDSIRPQTTYYVLRSLDGSSSSDKFTSIGNISEDMVAVVDDNEKMGFLKIEY